ncbi:hypothetical protein N7492_009150 [Penicillium capsulatum]|uniref:Carboxylic ester hydrolase n=1 Tax=Penicillium capsulatum TaxID=69766 RepID=A0A9W9HSF5_9EURO|nr:hypothetical protein N7492_009150 [Penicillium capsulatum]
METTHRPYSKSLSHWGVIEGVTISTSSGNSGKGTDLCHYFGGVRYALPLSSDGAGLAHYRRILAMAPRTDRENVPAVLDCVHSRGEAPKGGWPVFIFIHGGWLQFGTPNSFNAAALLGETEFKCVVVMPAYRLNLFGFLYSSELEHDAASVGETVGNHGFWDQRLAMEWTKDHVHLFGGNPDNITISGYSAGANSVFHQLAYDLRQPDHRSIIRQACIWSNSPAVQPKSSEETQAQFDQLLVALNIPSQLSANEKLARLRSIPPKELLDAAKTIDVHQFRPTTDTGFIVPTLFKSLDNGDFARGLLARNIRLVIGECQDERYLYSVWYPPKSNSLSALRTRLIADYPEKSVDAVIPLHFPNNKLPSDYKDWMSDAWGKIYADMQVHHMQRGLLHALTSNTGGADASCLLHRYRIEFRAKCVDGTLPVEWGVTHSSDYPIWFWGNGKELMPKEKEIISRAFIGPLSRFVQGPGAAGPDGFGWGTSGSQSIRTLKADGRVEIQGDAMWEEGVKVWKRVREVDTPQPKL